MTLGQTIRQAREKEGRTLRLLAEQLQITPSYLSDIELDRRVPADAVLERIGVMLGVSSDTLYAKAGRFDDATAQYVRSHPNAIRLLRTLARVDMSEQWLQHLIDQVNSPVPQEVL